MTSIEALDRAIEMLQAIRRAEQAEVERLQTEIRNLSAAVRERRAEVTPDSIDQGFAPAVPDRGPMLEPGGQPNREQP